MQLIPLEKIHSSRDSVRKARESRLRDKAMWPKPQWRIIVVDILVIFSFLVFFFCVLYVIFAALFHLPFLSSNPKILKAFLKTFPTKMKPTKCPAREKKRRQQKRKKRGGEKAKSKSQDRCITFKPRNFAFRACLNFASWCFASGSEGREVYDL